MSHIRLPYTAVVLAVFLVGLSAKPNVHAQAVPLWADVSGPTPFNETIDVLTYGPEGDLYVAGTEDVAAASNRGLYVARVNADGEALWERRLTVAAGDDLLPYGVYSSGADSVLVVLGETGADTGFGLVGVVSFARADGAPGARRMVGLSTEMLYGRLEVDTIPDSRDVLLSGETTDFDERTGGTFLARVTPTGEVVWVDEDVTFESSDFEMGLRSVAVAGDTVYAAAGRDVLLSYHVSDGGRGREGVIAGRPTLASRDTNLYAAVQSGPELIVSRLTDGATAVIGTVTLPSAAFQSIRSVLVIADSVVVYAVLPPGFGGDEFGLTRVALSLLDGGADVKEGRSTLELADGTFDIVSFGAVDQSVAVTPAGALVLVGAIEKEDFGRDGALVRLVLGESGGENDADILYRFGTTAPFGQSEVVSLAERAGGGVLAVRQEGGRQDRRYFLRALDERGVEVSDVELTSSAGGLGRFSKFYGSASTPNGVVVAGAYAEAATDSERLELVRFSAGAERLDSRPLDAAFVYDRANRASLAPDENGRYLLGTGYSTFEGRVAQVTAFTEDLRVLSVYEFTPEEDSIFSIDLIQPLDGTDDFLMSGQLASIERYVALIGADGSVLWRTDFSGASDLEQALAALSPQPDGRIAVVAYGGQVRFLEADGREAGTLETSLPGFFELELDARSDDPAPLLASLDVAQADGRVRYDNKIFRLDLTTGQFVPVASLPSVPAFGPRVYREFGGRAYVGGAILTGSSIKAGVAAFASTLTPVTEAAATRRTPARAFPNPAAAGQEIDIATEQPVAAWTIIAADGRRVGRVGRVLAKAGRVALPLLPAGAYYLRGRTDEGAVVTAALLIE